MKSVGSKGTIGILLSITFAAFVISHAASPARNLLLNSDFESAGGGAPAEWILDPALADRGEVSVESPSSGDSHRALKLSPNNRNTDKDKPFGVGQLISARELKGKKLLVQAAMRTSGGAFGVVMAVAVTEGGKPVHSVYLRQIEPTSSFVPQKGYLEVRNASKIIVGCVTNSTQGSVWFSQLFVGPPSVAAEVRSSRSQAWLAMTHFDASRLLATIMPLPNPEAVREGNAMLGWSRRCCDD